MLTCEQACGACERCYRRAGVIIAEHVLDRCGRRRKNTLGSSPAQRRYLRNQATVLLAALGLIGTQDAQERVRRSEMGSALRRRQLIEAQGAGGVSEGSPQPPTDPVC